MGTFCQKRLHFKSVFGKKVVGDFDGGRITSDAGGLLLRELDERYGLTKAISVCLFDSRDSTRVTHDVHSLLRQRIMSIALGYEDANDADRLRSDPLMKMLTGRLPETDKDLASQPTLCRLENSVSKQDLYRLSRQLFSLYLRLHPGPRDLIVLDIDATDDPTHGRQQLSFYHGYHNQSMYHPLLVFDGVTGFPLAAVLRAGNTHASYCAKGVLKRIIKKLKKAYPEAQIVLRADAGFALPGLYRFCERQRIYYVIGMITNERLKQRIAGWAARASEGFQKTQDKQRLFTSFSYRAHSWNRSRRIIAKVEWLDKGPNLRFVVTNFLFMKPGEIYDEVYVFRGDAENRIKELKLDLKADRLSCHRFYANQFRLLLHVAAYYLMLLLRKHLSGTFLQNAQVGTLRLILLKIGARIRETRHRIRLHLASGYPHQTLFASVLKNIRNAPS